MYSLKNSSYMSSLEEGKHEEHNINNYGYINSVKIFFNFYLSLSIFLLKGS